MQQTTNYQLLKPEASDFVNVEDLNTNMDTIDSALKTVADSAGAALPASSYTASDILTKIKTVDGAGSGLDADLFKGNSVIPITNGGTGATTAVDARTNLGITPANIGAVPTSGGTMTGKLNINQDLYAQIQLNSTGQNTRALIQMANNLFQTYVYNVAGDSSTYRYLALANSNSRSSIGQALWINDRTDSSNNSYLVLTEANAASIIQNLLSGGNISVIKSVQRGTVAAGKSGSGQIAITAVNPSKTFVNLVGTVDGQGGPVQLKLNSSTQVSWTRSYIYSAVASSNYSGFSWEVVEYC